MSDPRRTMPMTFVDSQVTDGIATLTITRPQAGNALNWATISQLQTALTLAAESADVKAIVITGSGNRFSSGADLSSFVRYLQAGDVQRIVDLVRASQELFSRIADCPKPVVAAVQGAAIGGGVELALAAHQIVATPRASFSFPETGLGIVPFSGGTFRTPRRIGTALSKWLLYTGHVLSPAKALQIGLIEKLVMPDQLASAARETALAAVARPADHHERKQVPAEFAALSAWFEESPAATLCEAEPAADALLRSAQKAVSSRPLAALQWAERLIDSSLASTPDAAAAAALAAVPELFSRPEVAEAMIRVAQQQQRKAADGDSER